MTNFTSLKSYVMETKINTAQNAFENWKTSTFQERTQLLQKLKLVLEEHRMRYATLITQDMGKPIAQSLAEVDKCGWLCEYYVEHAESFLQSKHMSTEALESF